MSTPPDALLHTPLYALHVELGARLEDLHSLNQLLVPGVMEAIMMRADAAVAKSEASDTTCFGSARSSSFARSSAPLPPRIANAPVSIHVGRVAVASDVLTGPPGWLSDTCDASSIRARSHVSAAVAASITGAWEQAGRPAIPAEVSRTPRRIRRPNP